ncbi:MAG: response regulator [Chitinophagaceae bacterium]|nr:MAG: response regulator [Chitinophagaceae bacterium]
MSRAVKLLFIESNEGGVINKSGSFKNSAFINISEVITNERDAMDFIKGNPPYEAREIPELIVLDSFTSDFKGLEILKQLKSNQQLRHIPVIVLSNSTDQKDIDLAYFNYASCFISKPKSPKDYADVIKKIELFWSRTAKLPY